MIIEPVSFAQSSRPQQFLCPDSAFAVFYRYLFPAIIPGYLMGLAMQNYSTPAFSARAANALSGRGLAPITEFVRFRQAHV